MSLYIKSQKFHYPLPIHGKLFAAGVFYLTAFAAIAGHSCEKHESKHQITYGKPKEKRAVSQHFSLNSPEFISFVKEEFLCFKKDIIETGFEKMRLNGTIGLDQCFSPSENPFHVKSKKPLNPTNN